MTQGKPEIKSLRTYKKEWRERTYPLAKPSVSVRVLRKQFNLKPSYVSFHWFKSKIYCQAICVDQICFFVDASANSLTELKWDYETWNSVRNHNLFSTQNHWLKNKWLQCRLWRWWATIPSLDQWWTTIVNHWNQWLPDLKTIENHWSQWLPLTIPFNGDGTLENH